MEVATVLDAGAADALDAPGPAAVILVVVAFVYGEPGPAGTCALEELVLVELVLLVGGVTLVLEGLMPEVAAPGDVPGNRWLELPPQSPVGIPHPLPPAIGHHFGSGSVGDQSVIGIST